MTSQKSTVSKKELTLEILKQHLKMNDNGDLVWINDNKRAKANTVAGTVREKDGYHSIVLLGVNYSGKQLKHFYKTGTWVNFFKKSPVVQVQVTSKDSKVVSLESKKSKSKVKDKESVEVKEVLSSNVIENPLGLMDEYADDEEDKKFYDSASFWNTDMED